MEFSVIRYDRRVYRAFSEKPTKGPTMLNRIKKRITTDEATQIALLSAFASVIGITTYHFVGKKLGYAMVRPLFINDDGVVFVQTIHGKILEAHFPNPK